MEKICTQCGLPGKFVIKNNIKFNKTLQQYKEYKSVNGKCNKCVYKNEVNRKLVSI